MDTIEEDQVVAAVQERYGRSCSVDIIKECIYVKPGGTPVHAQQTVVRSKDFYGLVFVSCRSESVVGSEPLDSFYNSVHIYNAERKTIRYRISSITYADKNTGNPRFRINYFFDEDGNIADQTLVDLETYYTATGLPRTFPYDGGDLPAEVQRQVNGTYWIKHKVSLSDGTSCPTADDDDEKTQFFQEQAEKLQQFFDGITNDDSLAKKDVTVIVNARPYGDFTNARSTYCTGNVEDKPIRIEYGVGLELYEDIFAHEFAHALDNDWRNGPVSNRESGAVMEAVADIYGELFEAYSKNKPCDWVNYDRNMKNPKATGNPTKYTGDSWYPETSINPFFTYNDMEFTHRNSTVISHIFCVLNNYGYDSDTESVYSRDELTRLLYRMMLTMPVDCSFQEFANQLMYHVYFNYRNQPKKLERAWAALKEAGLDSLVSLYSVTGLVVDQSGNPVSSAVVTVSKELNNGKSMEVRTMSDASGAYRVQYLTNDFYRIKAETTLDSGSTVGAEITQAVNQPEKQAESIVLPCYLVSGTVLNQKNRQPVSDALLSIQCLGEHYSASSDSSGSFRLLLRNAPTQLACSSRDHYEWTCQDAASLKKLMTILLEPKNVYTVTGFVQRENDFLPIAGAQVYLLGGGRMINKTTTDEVGMFQIACTPGQLEIIASATGYARSEPYGLTVSEKEVDSEIVLFDPILLEKALVTDAYSPELDCFVKIPMITLDTEEAIALNQQMYDDLSPKVIEGNYSSSYSWEVKENVLSIVASTWVDMWSHSYKNYTLVLWDDPSFEETLTPRQHLIATGGYTEEAFDQIVAQRAAEIWDNQEYLQSMDVSIGRFGQADDASWEEARNKTLAPENIQAADISLHDGDLHVRMRFYYAENIAGSTSIWDTDYSFIVYAKK